MRKRNKRPDCKRVGRVSYYFHHGSWWIYYLDKREGTKPVRRPVAKTEEEAAAFAAQVNAQIATSAPTMFSFTPVTVPELRQRFLDHHEHVVCSSLATVNRYRWATQHLENYVEQNAGKLPAHAIDPEGFVRHLRTLYVSPNGHSNSNRRPLRDKGVKYILETCRSMYGYAAKKRLLSPYADNPFSGLGGRRFVIDDSKRIFVYDQTTEHTFFNAADDWTFPIHFLLAKTGLRPGEATHLLVEDVDFDSGWAEIRNKPELGWRIKTRRERCVPLIEEVVLLLRRQIGKRKTGPVFLREKFVASDSSLTSKSYQQLVAVAVKRIDAAARDADKPLTRAKLARIHRDVWRDAGMVRSDAIRNSFIRINRDVGFPEATCPKSWRHSFATLLQDANVDPLIRQITMGHGRHW